MQLESSKPTLAKLNEDFPKIKKVEDASQLSSLLDFLVRILNIRINTPDDQQTLDFQMPLVLDLIRTKFGYLTIPEVQEAFKMYVAKEFTAIKVFRMLDCIAVGEVLNAFTEYRSDRLRAYTQKKQIAQLAAKNEISESQKEQITIDAINARFEHFKETKLVEQPCFWIFDFLVEKGLIKLPADNTPKINAYFLDKRKQAQKIVIKQLKTVPTSSKNERNQIKIDIEKVLNLESVKLQITIKQLVIADYFEKQQQLNAEKIL
jgi:hypothetical protein